MKYFVRSECVQSYIQDCETTTSDLWLTFRQVNFEAGRILE